MIANDVVAKLQESPLFAEVTAVNPGFINIRIFGDYLAGYLKEMQEDENLSVEKTTEPKTIVIDYGGAMWQNRCTSGICVLRSSARASSGSAVLSDIR